jgi:hypothetical protein
MYEVDGKVLADIYCERCGEVVALQVPRQVVTDLVMGNTAVICTDCQESRCKKCFKYPPTERVRDTWANGICWECRDEQYGELLRQVGIILYSSALSE